MGVPPKISGIEAYELMKTLSEGEETLRTHFRGCPLEKAIYSHASTNDCVLFEYPKGYNKIEVHRGTGMAIHIRDFRRYPLKYENNPKGGYTSTEPDTFGITLEVEFWSDEYDNSKTQHFHLSPPVALLTNFSAEIFDEWIAKLRKERNTAREVRDLESLRALILLYPAHAELILKERL